MERDLERIRKDLVHALNIVMAILDDKKEEEPRIKYAEEAASIIEFLNKKAGRHFLKSDVNLRLVNARLKELVPQHSIEDAVILCKKIIVLKLENSFFIENGFIRPATLFSKTKFQQYLEEVISYEAS